MDDILTLEQIEAKYPSEWVLLGDPVTDQYLNVQGGRVLWHGNDQDTAYKKAEEIRPGRFAVIYAGQLQTAEFILL